MNNIPIFLASDNNYAPFVATTIASICKNTDSFCAFYILDGGISQENQDRIASLKSKFDNFSLEFVKIDAEKYFKNFIVESYITIATYYRFVIADLFPELHKVLYLDVDIIAKGNIADLYNIDLEGYILGAVIDQGNKSYVLQLKKNLDMDVFSHYFNAGVLLLDLKKWREQNITQKLFEIEKKYRGKLFCNDQDVLNKLFERNYKELPTDFNSMVPHKNEVIRHFYNKIKPWLISESLCENEYQDFKIFWHYARMTEVAAQIKCKYQSKAQLQILKLYEKAEKKENLLPKISVIIPIYNVESYLRKCLDSVCYQTLKDIEIICANDCSPDNSLEILKEYACHDKRIKIIDFEKNQGVAIARNEAMKLAKGEYICFIDPDDWIDLDFCEKLYNKAKEYDSDLVIGNVVEENENGIKNFMLFDLVLSKALENKLHFNQLFSLGLYKKSLLDEHNITFIDHCIYGEDRLLPLMASFYAKNFQYDLTAYYHYFRNSSSVTKKRKNEKILSSFILSNEKIFDFLTSQSMTKEDYLTVAFTFWDNMLTFALILDETLYSEYLKEFYSCIIPKIRHDIIVELPLSKDLLSFLCHADYKTCLTKIKAYSNQKTLAMLRKRVAKND